MRKKRAGYYQKRLQGWAVLPIDSTAKSKFSHISDFFPSQDTTVNSTRPNFLWMPSPPLSRLRLAVTPLVLINGNYTPHPSSASLIGYFDSPFTQCFVWISNRQICTRLNLLKAEPSDVCRAKSAGNIILATEIWSAKKPSLSGINIYIDKSAKSVRQVCVADSILFKHFTLQIFTLKISTVSTAAPSL